ncbi:MAG: hypothetical protein ACOX04_09940 [Candidatus Scatomorpha sp.]|jgi:hypothetical protein
MKRKTRRTVSVLVTLLLLLLLPVQAFAETYDLAGGDITVTADDTGQYVSQPDKGIIDEKQNTETIINQTGLATANTVTINAEAGQTAEVTLDGVNIDCSATGEAAVSTTGAGDVEIELDGNNILQSGDDHAGLEKNNDGTLTIGDDNAVAGSLEATGGENGAGIGGGYVGNDASNITITGGEIEANGGVSAAGIGGGNSGDGSNIKITGGTVTAQGGSGGAGIGGGGGGNGGNGSDIEISGGSVKATGGVRGAGIGGGGDKNGSDIEISGGSVTAQGGFHGAGIGGGSDGDGSNITISGGSVAAKGGRNAAGIGGGNNKNGNLDGIYKGNGSNIKITGGSVTATGGDSVTNLTGGGASIGGGGGGKGSNFTVSGDARIKTQGGKRNPGKGACMGNGGYWKNGQFVDGEEVEPDTSGLTTGWIEFYEPGADMDKDAPTNVITAPKPGPKAAVDGTYKIGDKVVINGIEWIIVGIKGDVLELASVKAFTEEQLKDLEVLIKTLLTNAQLEKLVADKTTGERVLLADENIAKEYFGGEAGHIVIRADKSILG